MSICPYFGLSNITVTNISRSFTYKMAAKINGTKLRHCHRMYMESWKLIVCQKQYPCITRILVLPMVIF